MTFDILEFNRVPRIPFSRVPLFRRYQHMAKEMVKSIAVEAASDESIAQEMESRSLNVWAVYLRKGTRQNGNEEERKS